MEQKQSPREQLQQLLQRAFDTRAAIDLLHLQGREDATIGPQVEISNLLERAANLIAIDEELLSLIPPMSEQERSRLRTSIEAEGIRDPVIVWMLPDGSLTLVEGHNRCALGLETLQPFDVLFREFSDRESVKDWMISNQLGRRNLTDEQRTYLLGLAYNREKGPRGGAQPRAEQGDLPPGAKTLSETYDTDDVPQQRTRKSKDTAERLAKENSTSERSVKRAGKYAEGVERLAKEKPELRGKLLTGEVKAPKAAVEALADAPPEEVSAAAVAAVESGALQAPSKSETSPVFAALPPSYLRMRAGKGKVHLVSGGLHALCTYRPTYNGPGWQETEDALSCEKCISWASSNFNYEGASLEPVLLPPLPEHISKHDLLRWVETGRLARQDLIDAAAALMIQQRTEENQVTDIEPAPGQISIAEALQEVGEEE